MSLFNRKKKEWNPNDKNFLISFSFTKINTGMVCNLLYYLYKSHGFRHITYKAHDCKFYLYCETKPTKAMKQFFSKISPSEMQELCFILKDLKLSECTSVKKENGFLDYEVWNWKEI